MSVPERLGDLQQAYARLLTEIEAAENGSGAAERDRLRTEIIGLYKETETLLAELSGFKDRIKLLVLKFKALPAPPVAPRVDHLGSTTYLERGWGLIAAGDYVKATDALRRAKELAPEDPAVAVMLGWALMLRSEYDEALGLLQTVLQRDPGNLMARANLGYICLKKGIFGEAIEHLSRVLRAEADRKATLYANYYMGLLYLEREMYGDAKSFFARALELGPNLIEAWWELGRACYLEGAQEDAARAWRQGRTANRFSLWGERCGAALAALEAGEAVSFD